MNGKAMAQSQIPPYVRLIKAGVLAAVVLALAGAGFASADERNATEKRASVVQPAKPAATPPTRSKIATQKLMRNPWEKPQPKTDVMSQRSGTGNEELPYFYW